MSRLEGKQPNKTLYVVLVVMVLLAALAATEYVGFINLIPGF